MTVGIPWGMRRLGVLIVVIGAWGSALGQQVADPDFRPEVARPAFAAGTGPTVLIDEAHNNFHTVDGRYRPLAELLRRDGYQVVGFKEKFSSESLVGAKILVIANALADQNVNRAALPTFSAFTGDEITAVRDWVGQGGALLLIADHMSWGGAAAELASAFGFLFTDGFAFTVDGAGRMRFALSEGSLVDHPILDGRDPREAVDSVMTFTGQAFRVRRDVAARPLLVLGDDTVLLMPVQAWRFSRQTPRMSAAGMLQGATAEFGSGRVAVFGEAAMFSAQMSSKGQPMGMNDPAAGQNAQFALNVLHWLSGLL